MQTRRFIKNAAIMTVSALILRTIGMFFRVWLSNRIGAEGMGLYQLIFSVYMLAATFATTGICTAVTRLIAEELECGTSRSVIRILRRAISVTLLIGLASTALVYLLSDVIAVHWIKDVRAARSLRILSISLPFMGVSSCIRGYFVANRRVLTASNAQIFEQLVRMAIIMVLIGSFSARGIEHACAAVLIGDTIAESASCLFMYIGYLRDKAKLSSPIGARIDPPYKVVARLLAIAAPLAGGKYLTTALRTVESLLVPDKLTQFNGSREVSLSQYGAFKGMAMPVLFFLSTFLTALSTLLVPELSGSVASGGIAEVKAPVRRTVHVTLTASMLIAGVFTVFGKDIGEAFYGAGEVGIYICALAPLIPLMYLESVVCGMLNGLNQQMSIFYYNIADSLIRIALILLVVPRYGMHGFIAVTVISNLLTSLLCLRRLLKVSEVRFRASWVLKPLLCTLAAVTVGYAASHSLQNLSAVARSLIEGGVCAAVYLPMLYVVGGLDELKFVKKAVRAH